MGLTVVIVSYSSTRHFSRLGYCQDGGLKKGGARSVDRRWNGLENVTVGPVWIPERWSDSDTLAKWTRRTDYGCSCRCNQIFCEEYIRGLLEGHEITYLKKCIRSAWLCQEKFLFSVAFLHNLEPMKLNLPRKIYFLYQDPGLIIFRSPRFFLVVSYVDLRWLITDPLGHEIVRILRMSVREYLKGDYDRAQCQTVSALEMIQLECLAHSEPHILGGQIFLSDQMAGPTYYPRCQELIPDHPSLVLNMRFVGAPSPKSLKKASAACRFVVFADDGIQKYDSSNAG